MSGVLAVAHTGITVRSLDRAVGFWVDVLGAEVERRFVLEGEFAADVTGVPGARISAAVLLLGQHRLELLEYLAPAQRDHVRPRPNDLGSWHLAVEVADLAEVARRCEEYDWRLAGRPRTMADGPRAGTTFAYLHDEDGCTLELIEPAG
ncbi:hypothetical protein GCM10011519_21200 [Marmoricola endophyticus]|uniref:VOC domain-containing protein n=1 Tax=Marmoricola endophyticus TaxID=2040280 RepID=A0A917F4W8_9ACTN|nr:VOC family protein [Marmoricola endophyticus]GGF46956.1 hypothetical protein GCM10011519_21200 [Marmoricola endophyticus]